MKNLLGRYVNRYERKHKDFRRYAMIVAVLALVVFVGVNWRLHDKGISMTSDYQCGLKEHKHTADCYKKVLICGKEETDGSEGHTHTDACYKEEKKLTCGKEEHKHNADCYDEEGNLICDKEEHTHSKDCYTTEKKLICGKEESKPVKAHHHTDACYKKELVCKLKEHTHTAACYSNESADVEDESDWEATIPTLSGNWAEDIVAVAESQIGYEESTANFKLADDGETRKGYTRYGEWYGNKYGDWSAMFASFCLNYAGISSKTVPVNSGSTAWITELKQKKLYKEAGKYEPVSGDLVFLDTDSDGKADHVGIITGTETKDDVEDSKVTSLTAVVGDSSDKVEENTYKTSGDTIVGYCALPENPDEKKDAEATTAEKAGEETTEESTKTAKSGTGAESTSEAAGSTTAAKKASKKSTKSNSVATQSSDGIAVQDNESTSTINGINITDKVYNAIFKKKDGAVWKESDTFTTGDQVKGVLSFEGVKAEQLGTNRTTYITLPEGIDCSSFLGKTYYTKDNGVESGSYQYVKDSDGNWRIELTFNEKYIEGHTGDIGGEIEFEFQWSDNSSSDQGEKKNIVIGSWKGEVTITTDRKDDSGSSDSNYSLKKDSSQLSYSDDGKTGYIDYTVTLDVKQDTNAPIDLTDQLNGLNWEYIDSSLNLSTSNGSTDLNTTWETNSEGKKVIHIGQDGQTIKAGKYTITYRVQNTKISEVVSGESGEVSNTVKLPGDKNTLVDSTKTSTKTSTVHKEGKLSEKEDETYIDWTVYLNSGDIIKNIDTPANFKDDIPDNLELVGDVTVKQYDVKGNLTNTTTATVKNGTEISYTTPTGQYYYEITYRTKVKDSYTVPIGGTTIENTGTSTGGMNGSSSAGVKVPNHVVDKKYVSQDAIVDSDGKRKDLVDWETTISVEGSLKGYKYTDYAGTIYLTDQNNENGQHLNLLFMTDDQIAAIKVLDSDGNPLDRSLYEITRSSYTDPQSKVEVGLFEIIFKEGATGPVTLKYQTTVDTEKLSGKTGNYNITNNALLTDGKGEDTSSANTNVKYDHSKPKIIKKYGESPTDGQSGSITLEPGQTSIPWTIVVNDGKNMNGDLIVTDKIADGMTLDKSSLVAKIYSWDIYNKEMEDKGTTQVTVDYDETQKLLTIKIPESVYHYDDKGGSNPITISYKTDLDESFFNGDETSKSYTNTATVEENGTKTDSTFTQEVTRKVVGKNGSYDKENNLLTYNIILNPAASKLNDGKQLTVTDHLDAGAIAGLVKLKTLTLFTALKTTDSNGNVKIEPGTFVKELVKSDKEELYNYSYDEDKNEFQTYIPDETAYVLVAQYEVDADVAGSIKMNNEVQLGYNSNWKADDNNTKVENSTSGTTHKNQNKVTIIKHDKSQYNNLLNEAQFKLEKYDTNSSKWLEDTSLTTSGTYEDGDNKGKDKGAAATEIKKDVLYKLTETQAPSEYVKDDTPYYFILVDEGTTPTLPDSIDGDSDYKKSDVVIYTVEKNKYANIIINRYNAQDTTIVKSGQLRVNKKWVNGSNTEVTDPTELAKLPGVEVTLTKHEPPKGLTVRIKEGELGTPKTKVLSNLPTGCYIKVKVPTWSTIKTNSIIENGMGITKQEELEDNMNVYKIGPVVNNCTIIEGTLAWTDDGNFSIEGGTTSTDTIDTVIGTVTLDATNNWTYLWENLDTSDGVTYTVTEKTVDGYTVTYELNGEDLASDTAFEPKADGDKVTITNKAKAAYNLPETGGSGTLPFITVGASLMGFALLCGYSMRRRRGRRVE